MELVFCSCYQMKLVTQRCRIFFGWKVNQVQIQLCFNLKLNMKKMQSRDREFPRPFTPRHGWGGEGRRREKLVPKQSHLLSQELFSARYADLIFHPPTLWIGVSGKLHSSFAGYGSNRGFNTRGVPTFQADYWFDSPQKKLRYFSSNKKLIYCELSENSLCFLH